MLDICPTAKKATNDPLTGIRNKGAMEEGAERMIKMANANGKNRYSIVRYGEKQKIVKRYCKKNRKMKHKAFHWKNPMESLILWNKNRIIYHFTNIRSRYIIALSKE